MNPKRTWCNLFQTLDHFRDYGCVGGPICGVRTEGDGCIIAPTVVDRCHATFGNQIETDIRGERFIGAELEVTIGAGLSLSKLLRLARGRGP